MCCCWYTLRRETSNLTFFSQVGKKVTYHAQAYSNLEVAMLKSKMVSEAVPHYFCQCCVRQHQRHFKKIKGKTCMLAVIKSALRKKKTKCNYLNIWGCTVTQCTSKAFSMSSFIIIIKHFQKSEFTFIKLWKAFAFMHPYPHKLKCFILIFWVAHVHYSS